MTSKNKHTPPEQLHTPVLLDDTLHLLDPQPGQTYLDLTAGYGGHASKVILNIGDASHATLVDRDDEAIANLHSLKEQGARVIQGDFASVAQQLVQEMDDALSSKPTPESSRARQQFDMILMDLGVSSPQLTNAERGFSIRADGPLDMRMDRSQPLTAAEVVNTWSEQDLARIIRDYGEEPKARQVATAIIAARPLQTTAQLAGIVEQVYRGSPRRKVHSATRTFQAIRMALNDELGQIRRTLPLLPRLLNPGGRVAIISFHSLEDRLVKQFLKEQDSAGYEAELRLLTRRPIDGLTHDAHNPRARSAKLRAAVKI